MVAVIGGLKHWRQNEESSEKLVTSGHVLVYSNVGCGARHWPTVGDWAFLSWRSTATAHSIPSGCKLMASSTMDEEERPRKLPKHGHDDETTHQELGPAMTGAVAVGDEPATAVGDDSKFELSELPGSSDAVTATEVAPENATEDATPKMSKNQLKKLRRKEKWEQEREQRKDKRKDQIKRKRERRHLMIEEAREKGGEEAVAELRKSWEGTKAKHTRSTLLPLTIVIDCGYDDLMLEKERISLASQLTRSYSDNTRALWRSHLMFSSFDRLLKERFDTVLVAHKNWKGIKIIPEDFTHASELAKKHMSPPRGGKFVGPFAELADAKPEDGEIIYLSSDSENTLTELKPYSTYIIGGLVDKNRHKAICYKHAVEAGVKTAKLPIGEYVQMASRSVLATNHVVDIMLKWLELGDWGEAFMKVLPQRKGGTLKGQAKEEAKDSAEDEGEGEDEEETTLNDIAEEMQDEEEDEQDES